MIPALDISTSALVAQRTRLNAIASNMANVSSMRNENGEVAPYQARYAVFQTDGHFDGSKYEKLVEAIKGGGLHASDIDAVVADSVRLKSLDNLLRPVAQLPEAMFKREYELTNLKCTLP